MRVVANGNEVELADGAGLVDLFDVLGVGSRWVVAEVNGEAVDRSDMPRIRLSEGDRIELVRAVAGGCGPERSAGCGPERSAGCVPERNES